MANPAADVTFTEIKLETLIFTPPTLSNGINQEKPVIYPNPVKENIYMKNISAFENCIVYDSKGQKVYQVILNSDFYTIPFSYFKSGMYWITLSGNKGRFIEKIVKH